MLRFSTCTRPLHPPDHPSFTVNVVLEWSIHCQYAFYTGLCKLFRLSSSHCLQKAVQARSCCDSPSLPSMCMHYTESHTPLTDYCIYLFLTPSLFLALSLSGVQYKSVHHRHPGTQAVQRKQVQPAPL